MMPHLAGSAREETMIDGAPRKIATTRVFAAQGASPTAEKFVQQGSVRVRELLRRICERTHAYRELAALLLADAEQADDDDVRYQCFRQAADILITWATPSRRWCRPSGRASCGPTTTRRCS